MAKQQGNKATNAAAAAAAAPAGDLVAIVPVRDMQLDGIHCVTGEVTHVSANEAAKALRHGWAVAAPADAQDTAAQPAA